jgi:hypothetical protein
MGEAGGTSMCRRWRPTRPGIDAAASAPVERESSRDHAAEEPYATTTLNFGVNTSKSPTGQKLSLSG